MRSARNIYRLNLALAALGGLAVMLAAAVALRGVELSPAPAERLAAYCTRFLLPQVTAGSAPTLALGLLGAAVAILAVRSGLRQLRGCRRFLRALAVEGERVFGGARVLIVSGSGLDAFCAGFLRPRIYLSSAAAERLTDAELEAVIAHEHHHARRRDPLRILIVGMLADALFFMPALRRLKRRYEELAEIAADESAVAVTNDPATLAAALLRFGERGAPGVVGIAPERVDHLLGAAPRWELPVSLIAGALVTIAGLVATAATTAHVTGSGRISLTLLAAQSCMVTMAAIPVVAVGGLAVLARRAVSTKGA